MGLEFQTLSKRERAHQWLLHHPSCPLMCLHCHQALRFDLYLNSFHCVNRHQFDLNKKGTLFLAKKSVDDKYTRALFEARRAFITNSAFYIAMQHAIANTIIDYATTHQQSSLVITDLGAGEGSHLHHICQLVLNQQPHLDITAIGIDLAKDATLMASDYLATQFSIVGDLGHIPLEDASVDIALCILSPSNYKEFNRILKSHGQLIKVIPNARYLGEIRDTMGHLFNLDQQTTMYSNDETANVFSHHYPDFKRVTIFEEIELSSQHKSALVAMTPLTWRLSNNQKTTLIQQLPHNITLDIDILIAQKNSQDVL